MQAEMKRDETPNEQIGMAITIEELQQSIEPLKYLAGVPMKAKVSIKLAKIINQVQIAVNENELTRHAICQQHGEINPETQNYDIREEEKDVFGDKIVAWKQKLVTFPQHPISVADLGNAQLPPDLFIRLDWLFV